MNMFRFVFIESPNETLDCYLVLDFSFNGEIAPGHLNQLLHGRARTSLIGAVKRLQTLNKDVACVKETGHQSSSVISHDEEETYPLGKNEKKRHPSSSRPSSDAGTAVTALKKENNENSRNDEIVKVLPKRNIDEAHARWKSENEKRISASTLLELSEVIHGLNDRQLKRALTIATPAPLDLSYLNDELDTKSGHLEKTIQTKGNVWPPCAR
jgi:hypothetical protein